jgi:cell division septal protein FtsQ
MMDYTLKKSKGSRLNWGEVHSRQRKKNKRPSKTLKGRKIKNRKTGLRELAKTWLDVFAKAALVMIMGYGAFHGYRFITTAPQFAVAHISFSGNDKVSQSTLEGMAQPLLGQNIFELDLQSITEQFKANPWIENVSAARRLPQGIRIKVQERVPYARIQLDRTYLMDHYGVLIVPGNKEYSTLPLSRATQYRNFICPVHSSWYSLPRTGG